MKLKILAGVAGVTVLLASAGIFRYFYTRSPKYAFAEIKKAVEDHDKDRFYEFVDLDSLLSHGVDDFMAGQQKKDNSFATNFAAGLVALMKPRLIEILKEQVERVIEGGSLPASEAGKEPEVNLAGYFGAAQANATLKSNKREGKITTVGFEITHAKYGIPIPVYVRLREHDGHLRVTEIANLREINEKVDAAEHEWKAAKNRPVRDALDHALRAGEFVANKRTDEWNIEKRVELFLPVKNLSSKPIKAWSGDLALIDSGGKTVLSLPLRAELSQPLASNTGDSLAWDFHINQFMDRDVALWTADFSQLHSDLHLRQVSYSDGEELVVPYPDVEGQSSP